jgi:two-component system phosphate regulon sensor histidine kinase PhoR
MKLEKVGSRPNTGLWVFLFILGLAVIGVMAASYNVEIVKNVHFENPPWVKIALGALGFAGILFALILFFARLLREMRIGQIQADFLDRISHELRTPLSTLTLVGDLLKSGTHSSTEVDRLWHSHELELDRLKNDVELLLQAARLRETRVHADLVQVELETWLDQHWEEFRTILGPQSELKRTGVRKAVLVNIDTNLFDLIFRNLLDNARKFSLDKPVVELKTERFSEGFIFKKTKWRVSVSDQGVGFEPKNETYLFKRFSRLPFKKSELKPMAIPGTGLGLYLSATASRAMGISLSGSSFGEGKGAQFVLEGRSA